METNTKINKIEVADILNNYSGEFIEKNNLSYQQIKAIKAIESCRTSELGYHKLVCNKCGYEQISYNSCRNPEYSGPQVPVNKTDEMDR